MDAKQLFLQHFEKLALGIAVAILTVFLVTAFGQNPADAEREKVVAANRQIGSKKELATQRAPQPEAVNAAREVGVALASVAEPKAFPTWLFYKRPVVASKFEGIEIPEAHHFAPSIDRSEGGLGYVSFTWSDDPRNALVKIDKYVIRRAEGDPSKFKDLTTLNPDAKSFVDKDVKPKVQYFYQVVSTASVDTTAAAVQRVKAKGYDVVLAPTEVTLASGTVGPLTTKKDVHIEVISVVLKPSIDEIKKDPNLKRDPSAFLKVWKYFPDKQKWIPFSYPEIKVGQTVGKPETLGGDKLDFTTDWKLVGTRRIRVEKSLGEVDADAVELEDTKTGERVILNNQILDPELEKVKKNPNLTSGDDAADDKDKKATGGKPPAK